MNAVADAFQNLNFVVHSFNSSVRMSEFNGIQDARAPFRHGFSAGLEPFEITFCAHLAPILQKIQSIKAVICAKYVIKAFL